MRPSLLFSLILSTSSASALPSYEGPAVLAMDAQLPQAIVLRMDGLDASSAASLDGLDKYLHASATGPSSITLEGVLPSGRHPLVLSVSHPDGDVEIPLEIVATTKPHAVFQVSSELPRLNYAGGAFFICTRGWQFYTSDDGYHWQKIGFFGLDSGRYSADDAVLFDGMYYVVSQNGKIYRSADLKSWELSHPGEQSVWSMSNWLRSLNGTLFKSRNGWKGIELSSDGMNWTVCDFGVEDSFSDLAYGDGEYVIVGLRYILRSADGLNWSILHDSGNSYNHAPGTILHDNGGFVISLGEHDVFFYDAQAETPLKLVSVPDWGIFAPWVVGFYEGRYRAWDAAGASLSSADGVDWRVESAPAQMPEMWYYFGDSEGAGVIAEEGVILRSFFNTNEAEAYRPTDLPQLLNGEPAVSHYRDSFSRVLQLSEATVVESVEGLPDGLTYDPQTRTLSGTFGERGEVNAIITLSNRSGTNHFALPFEIKHALPIVDLPDPVVSCPGGASAALVVQVTSEVSYTVEWEKVGERFWFREHETGFEEPYDYVRLDSVGTTDSGFYRAEVTNAGGTIHSEPIQLVLQETFEDWRDRVMPEANYTGETSGLNERESAWSQTNLERYALDYRNPRDLLRRPAIATEGGLPKFRFTISQKARDVDIFVQYSPDLTSWNETHDLVIRRLWEDAERRTFEAYPETPSSSGFYRLHIDYNEQNDGASSGSGGGVEPLIVIQNPRQPSTR